MFSTGPDEDSGDNSGGGVFFADLSAFHAGARLEAQLNYEGDCDGDEDLVGDHKSIHWDVGQQKQSCVGPGDLDFRAIADRAIAALDREYRQTFHAPGGDQI
jgi:hypothetical protein